MLLYSVKKMTSHPCKNMKKGVTSVLLERGRGKCMQYEEGVGCLQVTVLALAEDKEKLKLDRDLACTKKRHDFLE